MIRDPLLLAGLAAIIVILAALVFADDGMAACQLAHSFDVCHDALH